MFELGGLIETRRGRVAPVEVQANEMFAPGVKVRYVVVIVSVPMPMMTGVAAKLLEESLANNLAAPRKLLGTVVVREPEAV